LFFLRAKSHKLIRKNMTTNTALSPGTRIGGYEIISLKAQGGMGMVYRARNIGIGREVALKVLFPHLSGNAEFTTRFQREAQTAAKLRHPNIVEVYDASEADGYHFIVMEYIAGDSLAQRLEKLRKTAQHMPIEEVVKMTRQIAAALDYAHAQGFIHRDIKPGNIMQASDDRYVLGDFGIVYDQTATRLTRTVNAMGTPEYMSPEQGQGLPVDGRSDLYSLGVVLYEALAGRVPFVADTPVGVVFKHVQEKPTPIVALRTDIPEPIRKAVNKALAKKPQERYQTGKEFAAALDAALAETKPKRKVWPILAGAGGLAALILVGAVALAQKPSALPATPTALPLSTSEVAHASPVVIATSEAVRPVNIPTQAPPTAAPAQVAAAPATSAPQTPTPTSLPTAAPSATPTKNATPTTPATPASPVPTRPASASYASPKLISPAANGVFGGADHPLFSWGAVGPLAASDYYQFVIQHPKGADVICTKKTSALGRDYIPSISGGQVLRWSVAVVRASGAVQDGGACTGQIVASAAEARPFTWQISASGGGGGGGGGQPNPGVTPCTIYDPNC
jgi:serine/threonine-protein kinase